MPIRPVRASSAARSACHTASGTITSPCAGIAGAAPSADASSRSQGSVASFLSLMMVPIDTLLEWLQAGTPDDVDKTFLLAFPPLQVNLDQLLDDVGNLRASERRTNHLAHRCWRSGTCQPLVA